MNRKHLFRWITGMVLIAVMVLALAGCASWGRSEALSEEGSESERLLNLSVAASLTDAMLEIQQLYAAECPHISLEFNFGSSGSLQQQIEQGAPTDILCRRYKQMDELQEQDLLLAETRLDLLENNWSSLSRGLCGYS